MARNGLTQRQKWYFSGTSQGVNQSGTLRKASNGAWRSPVAHLLWEQGVPGSNPGAPIRETSAIAGVFAFPSSDPGRWVCK